MKQLLLELATEIPATLDNFVVGRNAELLALLVRIGALPSQAGAEEHLVYLWGPASSGKSHLLQALAAQPQARYIGAAAQPEAFDYTPATRLYLLDDCDQLGADAQIDAFALYNQVREHGALLVAAGALPPAQLALREDLRTRLGWGLVYQLHGLSDDDKVAALTLAAQTRGLSIGAGVLPYLITHCRRDMGSLSALLAALDRYSLETRRPITLPLLRQLLQHDDLHFVPSDP